MTPHFAGALITDQHGRYLLQLRDDKPGILHPGAWGLFGGGIEPDEAPEAAVLRELVEEIGIAPSPPTPFRTLRLPTRIGADPIRVRAVAVFSFVISAAQVPALRQAEGAGRGLWPAETLLLQPRVSLSARLAVALHAQARLGSTTAPYEYFAA
jgi:8-oxo-dGTP pyrophosphatase MutT (NUDIX family)